MMSRGRAYRVIKLNRLYASSWFGDGKKLKVTHWVKLGYSGWVSTWNMTLWGKEKRRQFINHSTDSDFNFPEILKTLILKIVFILEMRHLEVKTLLTFHWLNYSSPRYSQTILRNIFLENQRNISLK